MFLIDDRYHAVRADFVPWIEGYFPLAGRTVLEYGCGTGAIGCALSHAAGRVIGFDINAGSVRRAQRLAAELDRPNAEFRHEPLDRIMPEVEAFEGSVDVFVLYALLEHTTLSERVEILSLARRVVKPDGVIVVCEAPNRLLPHDYHTSRVPFFSMLPVDLALRSCGRSPRREFVEALAAAMDEGPQRAEETLARWGRGISYHDFELVFEDLGGCTLACNYDAGLLPRRHVEREELDLAWLMDRAAPELPPSFSRYYIDLILTPTPRPRRRGWVRPWAMHTLGSHGVVSTPWRTLKCQAPGGGVLRAEFPAPTSSLVLGVEARPHHLSFRVRGERGGATTAELPGTDERRTRYAPVELDAPTRRIEIEMPEGSEISFVGYEDRRVVGDAAAG